MFATDATIWEANGDFPKRRVRADTPRGWCYCKCGERLGYQHGSIAWQCVEEDLCGSCAGKDAADRIFEKRFKGKLK